MNVNKILDVSVNMNLDNRKSPEVYCLFDEVSIKNMIFKRAGEYEGQEEPFSELKNTMNLEAYNLLGIDNDIAVWFYYSAYLIDGTHQNFTINVQMDDGSVVSKRYDSLWFNNVQAINFQFPDSFVMDIYYTDVIETFESKKSRFRCGALVDRVVPFLKQKNYRVGLVQDTDGYQNVQPLMPDASPKNQQYGAKLVRLL